MKKITIIGDLHGRDIWKRIVDENPDSDLYIFVGDYFDSFDIDILTQMHNFKDIIAFRKDNPDKVITLLGNHDFHYTSSCIGSYSGFNHSTYFNMRSELDALIKDGTLLIAQQI
jgi:predicted phosphodiesterase